MSFNVFKYSGTINDLTICLQACERFQLAKPPELILEFESLKDKHSFENLLPSLLEDSKSSAASENDSKPSDSKLVVVRNGPRRQEALLPSTRNKSPDIVVPNMNNIDVDIEFSPVEQATPTKQDQNPLKHNLLDGEAEIESKAVQNNKKHTTDSPNTSNEEDPETSDPKNDEEIDIEEEEMKKNLEECNTMNLSLNHSIMASQQLTKRCLAPDPIKWKYIFLQFRTLKEMLSRCKCWIDTQKITAPKIMGYEKNVDEFEKEFNFYIASLHRVQIDRKLTVSDFNLIKRSKSVHQWMKEHHVGLVKFNQDTENISELQRNQTVGYLVGESKEALEIVKRYINNFYPKKIILYRVPKKPKINKNAMEEYMNVLYLDKIFKGYEKFGEKLESELKVRVARDFFEFYLIAGSSKNIIGNMEMIANSKAQQIFILNFSLSLSAEKTSLNGEFWQDFWKQFEVFSNRLLKQHLVLKCAKGRTNGELRFALVGRTNANLDPFKQLPLFKETTGISKAVLTLRVPPKFSLKDSLAPKTDSVQVKAEDRKKPYIRYELSGPIDSVMKVVSSIFYSYSSMLKNNTPLKVPNEKVNGPAAGKPGNDEKLLTLKPKTEAIEERKEAPKGALREIAMLDTPVMRLPKGSEEITQVRKLLLEILGEEIASVQVIKFSDKTLWDKYCKGRTKWTSHFGASENPEQSEIELVSDVALEQADFEEVCKDHNTFNETIKLKDTVQKKELSTRVSIKGKDYYMCMVFLAFLPYTKETGSSYLLTESYAAYPLYTVFIPA